MCVCMLQARAQRPTPSVFGLHLRCVCVCVGGAFLIPTYLSWTQNTNRISDRCLDSQCAVYRCAAVCMLHAPGQRAIGQRPRPRPRPRSRSSSSVCVWEEEGVGGGGGYSYILIKQFIAITKLLMRFAHGPAAGPHCALQEKSAATVILDFGSF
jgi:hypothetical protein